MNPEYTVIIYTPQELSQSSYIQTGLFELEQTGFIKVKVEICLAKKLGRIKVLESDIIYSRNQAAPKTSYYKLIDNSTNEQVTFATDLYDFANEFSLCALENCDVVFKRNYEKKFINLLSKEHQFKLKPTSLTFWVHSDYKRKDSFFFLGLFLSNLNVNFKIDRFLFKRLYNSCLNQLKHWRFIKSTRKLSRYENFVRAEKNIILFQTRCFNREDKGDITAIHQQRYRIIKVLKSNFPDQFSGGFIPSTIALQNYKDAITNVPSEPEKYLDILKSSKIVIYTRGLINSPAWKMAEYLSQGKVIIAERLTAELPVPLINGKEVLFFDDDIELLNNIRKVLNDNVLAKKLSTNARLYFEQHVHPEKSVKQLLNLMVGNFKSQK